jgi:hypothetical protein
MVKFIKLLDWDTDTEVEVNPEHIRAMRPASGDSDYETTVYVAGMEPLKVKHTVAEIKQSIVDAESAGGLKPL